jgi:pimeloyl-ACP methyl ester carboxylesterase
MKGPAGLESIYDHPSLVRSRITTVDGYQTHHLECGAEDAQPVVLMHGANWDFGLGADRWFPTMVPLGRTFRVIAPDQLGGGATDAPRDISQIGNLQVRAQHMLEFVEGLGVGPVHLVGQSQGAWIAAFIALRRPDLVDRLVLVESSSLAMPVGGLSTKGLAPRFEETVIPGTMVNRKINEGIDVRGGVRESLEVNLERPDVLIEPYLDACMRLADKWAPIWREPWRDSWQDPASHAAQYLVDGELLARRVEELPPALLVWRKTPTAIFDNGAALFQAMRGAEFYVLEDCGHFLWQDRWETFNGLVSWYLGRNGRQN